MRGSIPNRARRINWLWVRQHDGDHQGPRRCLLCGGPFTGKDEATIDHLVPLSRGGTHALHNLALAHRECNIKRGQRRLTPEQKERHDRWFPGPKVFDEDPGDRSNREVLERRAAKAALRR